MMQTSSLKRVCLILIGGMIVLWGCDSAPVDKNYLESKKYKQFRKTQKEEYAAQVNDRHTLQKYLDSLIRCDKRAELQLPLQFSKKIMKKAGAECKSVNVHFNTAFDIEIIGYSYFKPVFIRWVLLNRETVYKNVELLAVTHTDTSMLDFHAVGKFRKNLSQKISTDITVSQKGHFVYISSVSERNLRYPIEQEQVVKNRYIINRKGQIRIQ